MNQPHPQHPHGMHRHDSYPLIDRHFGGVVSANDLDFDYHEPYGVMHPGDGDGYDVFRVADGYVSGSGSRDGSGYRQTFFGPGCRPYNGWGLFPHLVPRRIGARSLRFAASFPFTATITSKTASPIRGIAAPRPGLSPDRSSPGRSNPDLLSAACERRAGETHRRNHSRHTGSRRARRFPPPISASSDSTSRSFTASRDGRPGSRRPGTPLSPHGACRGPTEFGVSGGVAFQLARCHDWSVVDVFDHPKPRVPWPYPEANVLMDQHFDEPGAPAGGPARSRPADAQPQPASIPDASRHATCRRTRRASTTYKSAAAVGRAILRRCCFRTCPLIRLRTAKASTMA